MDSEAIAGWLSVLDELTYYSLLGVMPDATPDSLKQAFHAFAEDFHPDAHSARSHDQRDSLARIFKRGNEAYRVLSDPQLRARYDELMSDGESHAVGAGLGDHRQGIGAREVHDVRASTRLTCRVDHLRDGAQR